MFAVRDAGADDADAICDVQIAASRAAFRGIAPDSFLDGSRFEREHRARWRAWHLPAGSQVIVAVDDDRIVGFAALGPEHDPDDPIGTPRGEVYALYVHPDAWGSGAAASLLAEAEHRLAALGFTLGVLWTLAEHPRARAFYERSGWGWTGTTSWHEQVGDEVVASVEYTRRLT